MVTPHVDPEIIRTARRARVACIPGVATPSEGFMALRAGADALKIFPAEGFSPAVLWAWRSVFPAGTRFLPVGGISAGTFSSWLEAGVTGFGIGSALYRPGRSAEDVHAKAGEFIEAWRQAAAVR
jgi:2-dehydro-3-deoxyphosphogalactonate aldolase